MPSPLRKLFDYLPLPDHALPQPGCRVRISFGRQELTGIVMGIAADSTIERSRLKPVNAILDTQPLLDPALLQLYQWSSDYYLYPLGMVLQTSLPAAIRAGKPLEEKRYVLWRPSAAGLAIDLDELQRAPLQRQALELLRNYRNMSPQELSAALGKPAAPLLRALAGKGLAEEEASLLPPLPSGPREAPHTLNSEQAVALQAITSKLDSFHCHLLEGITGSGKTEIYLQAIERVLMAGKQVLVLVPEISLTPQTVERFTRRLQGRIVSFHSGLSDRQRLDGWVQAWGGKADIVIGTRSAVFTPLTRLGLIIVDEEHDDSYKQQEGFRYCARDLAVYRANQCAIPVVLGTATPSLESLRNALSGRYHHLQLGIRAGSAAIPRMQLVDMRIQEVREGFSLSLQQHIRRCLEANQQALVFLNRRGFAPLLQCEACGWIAECPRCERSYTLHQFPAALRCHHCEASKALPRDCPGCGGGQLGGIGMGTERSEAFLREIFEDFPIVRIDRDTTRAAGSLQELMDVAHSGIPCVLLGTQMLAKGHHFPKVTLVAILDADSGLFSADFRGQENFGQLLTQVAGRAGRGEQPGLVLIQSYHVQHPALQRLVSEGYATYARSLLVEREQGGLPPFGHLILLRAEASERQLPLDFLQQAREWLNQDGGQDIECFGPLPSPLGKKAGLFRAQLILQGRQRAPLHRAARALLARLEASKATRRVRWQIDVDPLDFS